MSRYDKYDRDDLERRFRELDEIEKLALEDNWKEIKSFLRATDRDWVKREHIEDDLEDGKSILPAYQAFLQVFQPPTGTADSFALYEMNYSEVVKAGEEIILGDDVRKREPNFVDEFLEGDYEDR